MQETLVPWECPGVGLQAKVDAAPQEVVRDPSGDAGALMVDRAAWWVKGGKGRTVEGSVRSRLRHSPGHREVARCQGIRTSDVARGRGVGRGP